MPTKKEKLKILLQKLNDLEKGSLDVSEVDSLTTDLIEEELAAITAKIKGNPTIQTLQKFKNEIAKFRDSFDLKPISEAIKGLQGDFDNLEQSILNEVEKRLKSIPITPDLTNQVDKLRSEFESTLQQISSSTIQDNLQKDIQNIQSQLQDLVSNDIESDKALETKVEEEIKQLRTDVYSRLSNLGGGAPNRQINVNSSVMSKKYTDINFQQFGNVAWSVSDDDVNKRVNIRASLIAGGGGSGGSVFNAIGLTGSSSGQVVIEPASVAGTWKLTPPTSGGSAGQYLLTDGNGVTQWASVTAVGGSGITRTTSIITANTAGAASASTDYVYICDAGLSFTLPNPSGNSNLYTVKNGPASILVTTVGGKTMDGSTSVLVLVPNQSLDFISDNSNYRIV